MPQDSLREQVGMVTQDTSLLHRSVRENFVYGWLDATEEAMSGPRICPRVESSTSHRHLAASRQQAECFLHAP